MPWLRALEPGPALVAVTAIAGVESDLVGLRRAMRAAIVLLVPALCPLGSRLVAQPQATRWRAWPAPAGARPRA